ncbi:GGDEF domain-containing protein [Phenylobacterium sp. J426]|uniref:GGDEF domain-containing protein n=1 Tax=Phenylobacterium sp. J426 TaxID=2898439 RepID=UPI002151DC12|nr:GGDEF domain-containing protein [Phenylobacterium sp. J426]MCR5876701.1 GGDEF domain-containing protein [Phenylobacterium sp. J426]
MSASEPLNPESSLRAWTDVVQALLAADRVVLFATDATNQTAMDICAAPPLAARRVDLDAAFRAALATSKLGPADELSPPSAWTADLDAPPADALLAVQGRKDGSHVGVAAIWSATAAAALDPATRQRLHRSAGRLALAAAVAVRAAAERRREQELQGQFIAVFQSIATGVIIFQGRGEPALVNVTAGRLLGAPSGQVDATLIQDGLKRLCEAAADPQAACEQLAVAAQEESRSASFVIERGEQHISIDVQPMGGEGGRGRIWLLRDVTLSRRREAELANLAASDPLTGLANRRGFMAEARAAAQACRAAGHPLTLLMIDLDHFKLVNDTYGHPTGDRVLRVVADRCRAALREDDLLGRLGGEEFAVLLPRTDHVEGSAIAERLRQAISTSPVAVDNLALTMRISVGGATRADGDVQLDALLAQADVALYMAKRSGRDRVVFAGGAASAG